MGTPLADTLERLRPLLTPRPTPDRRAAIGALLEGYASVQAARRARRSVELATLGAQLGSLVEALRQARSKAGTFSIFDVLQLQRREYVHSNMLAWLLDPLGTHHAGAVFLNAILKLAGLPGVEAHEHARVLVGREEGGGKSIIDIIVRTPMALLIIENKVDSREGEEQTPREWNDFAPRAEGRQFAAVFLTKFGEDPLDRRFQPWSYERIYDALAVVPASGVLAHFLDGYRRVVEHITGGRVMKEFKGYQEETRFVIDHWAEVTQLLDAVEAARADAAGLLQSIKTGIEESDWFDEDVWEVQVDSSKCEINLWKKSWETAEDAVCIGVTALTLDNLLKDDGKAWSYVYLPTTMQASVDRTPFTQAAAKIDKSYKSTRYNPVWRYLALADLKADPEKVKGRIVAEIEALRGFEPQIDAVTAK